MINIVCLKWGAKYGPEYVNRLYAGIKRHTTKNFKFWCFTEDPEGIHEDIAIVPLAYADQFDSWWNKIYLFSNLIPVAPGEQIFYVDLDTLIVNNIDDLLVEVSNKIIVLRDFYHGIAKTAGTVGSGLMTWRHGQYIKIWNEFIKDPNEAIRKCRPHGDQKWVELMLNGEWDFWQDLWPNRVVSFKVHCREGLPDSAHIVCYHGRPSIPESATEQVNDWRWKIDPQPWVLDHWKDQ